MDLQSTQVASLLPIHISGETVVQTGSQAETVVIANSAWSGEQAVVDRDWLQFSSLVVAWKRETMHSSSLRKMFASPHYGEIIAMDRDKAVPLILRQLILEGDTPYHWFAALVELTKEDAGAGMLGGGVRDISRSWIEWGRARYGSQLESK